MDVYESKKALGKLTAVDTTRRPLIPAEKNNAVTAASRRPRTREIGSRYKSPTPSGPSRRCSSPNIQRALSSDSQLVPKRAVSAERKRPQTPTSPTAPCTPVADSSIELPVSSRRMSTGRLPESLWPSTMRSLSVSFQSDTISIPVVKKEKQVNVSLVDRTLRPSSNVAHRQGVTPSVSRKPTPERKRSPLRGKNPSDQSENSKPVNSSRTIDQHRWPSRTAGKVNPNSLNKSLDLSDKAARVLSSPVPVMGLSLRRMSLPLQKSSSDTARLLSSDETCGTLSPPKPPLPHRLLSATTSLDRTTLTNAASRLHFLPNSQSRQASPSRNCLSSSSSSSSSRGVSPSHARPSTPLRGASPSRIRQSSSCTQSSSSSSNNSVLTFVADVKKGKKAGYIEEAHQLRMFYNRLLQWRFSNAQADAVMYNQKLTSEETLCNVWHATSDLRDIVTSKRIHLQQMKLQIKLSSILNDQMEYLEEWALLEREHVSYLTGAIEDLQANTLRLPVTGGAKADVESLKVAISSAVDVMQAMGSTMFSSFSMVEEMNSLASNLATVATRETSMLGKCKDLLASTASMQIEASSLITHLIQMKEDTKAMDPRRVFAN